MKILTSVVVMATLFSCGYADAKNRSRAVTPDHYLPFVLASAKYNLDKVRTGDDVPRIRVDKLPRRWGLRLSGAQRKDLFLKTLLPLILEENEQIEQTRKRLIRIVSRKHHHIMPEERKWLAELATTYRCKSHSPHQLLAHVDVIPPSMALGQGIVESGWGIGSVAFEKSSPFGHRPVRQQGKKRRVVLKEFESLPHAVKAYIHNINSHPAYKNLRHIRQKMRKEKGFLDAHALAQGLHPYSELGQTYVQKVQKIMRQNALEQFDQANLRPS